DRALPGPRRVPAAAPAGRDPANGPAGAGARPAGGRAQGADQRDRGRGRGAAAGPGDGDGGRRGAGDDEHLRPGRPAGLLPAAGPAGVVSFAAEEGFALAVLAGEARPPAEGSFWAAVAWLVALSTFGGYGLYWLILRRSGVTEVNTLMFLDRKSTRLNSSHVKISYAVLCLNKKN